MKKEINNMDNKLIIKTDKEIGEFLSKSLIDNRPLRLVTDEDLNMLNMDDYELIDIGNPMTMEDVLKTKSELIEKLNK